MLRVVGCFLEYEGKFVLLHRHAHKPNGGTWGLPAGKVEPGESDTAAVLRELWEETGGFPHEANALPLIEGLRLVLRFLNYI